MSDPTRPGDADLRETAETARRLAGDAEHDADLERPTAAGAGGHPHPDIRAADHLRAQDDVETYERQEELAESQADAAEALSRNREVLAEGREQLDEARRQAADNQEDVRELARDTSELGDQVERAHEAVRQIGVEDVDRGGSGER
ncbi:MAG TPA: hypothetical protein VF746_11440 [Longimicrobium sp.]|jgi:multidrug efflux pump subunit AcrA (membrane-fusion protein)